MRQAVVTVALAVVVLAVALAAPAATRPAPGLWEASLTDGFLRFQVTGSTVRNLLVSYRCTSAGGTLWTAFVPLPVRDGAVSIDEFTSMEATFHDATHARGRVAPNPGIGPVECDNRSARPFAARRLVRKPVLPVVGRWAGTDANGAPLTFVVDGKGMVKEFESGLTTRCAVRAAPTSFGVDAVIRPSTASFVARSRPVDFATRKPSGQGQDVEGTFRTPRAARGTLRELRSGANACDTGLVAWSAAPR